MKTLKFVVTLEVEDDVHVADAQQYVEDAVQCMGGSHHPDSPFFGDNKTVKVTRYRRPKKGS